MDVETTIRNSLLMFPTIEHNRLSVLNHLFLVIGNGYEWKKGELVEIGAKKSNATIEKAILKIVTRNLTKENIKNWFEVGELLSNAHGEKEDYAFDFLSEKLTNEIKNSIILTFDIDNRMKDMTPYSDLEKFPFTFYPICEYSALCNLPDDIKPNWLAAAREIYEFVVANPQLIRKEDESEYNKWLPKIKERIEELEVNTKQKNFILGERNNMDYKKEDWFEENASHGAFALTQEEIDFYYRRNKKP